MNGVRFPLFQYPEYAELKEFNDFKSKKHKIIIKRPMEDPNAKNST
jgi:hypothetical protein